MELKGLDYFNIQINVCIYKYKKNQNFERAQGFLINKILNKVT